MITKKLNIPSKVDSIKEVENLIDEISGELKITNTVYGNVLISVIEAVNNSIYHGNKLDPKKNVEITINYEKEKKFLQVRIKDFGPGFNFEKVPDPTSPENIEKLNGRGVFLMKRLTDDVVFHDNGSCVDLVFNID